MLTQLRDAEETDFERILSLNAAVEIQTSPMDLQRLRFLLDLSAYHKVAIADDSIAGFLLAMRDSAPYENDNHAWFVSRYRRFIYVDRIVVASEFAGRRIGSALYTDLFAYARARSLGHVVCEYNLEPPNPASRAFHERFGFREVGTQYVADGAKRVSLQVAKV